MAHVPVDQEYVNEVTRAAAQARPDRLQQLLDNAPPGTVNRTNKYGWTAIQAMNAMSPRITRILLEHGSNPNVRDPEGGFDSTPLHDMAVEGYLAIVVLLLEYGANVFARNNEGNTPAHLAAKKGSQTRQEVLEKLSHVCTMQECNNEGKTPLQLAEELQRNDVIPWLREFTRNPQSLMFYSRRAIRILVPPRRAHHLQLPAKLIQYLQD